MSSTIINNIDNIEKYSYLELGVFDNKNFNQIKCKNKYSVDTNGAALYTGTTDDYFASVSEETQFDIIYIDANHDLEYVIRDYNNSIKHAKKWIVIHDMIPPNIIYSQSKFCSDSYKLLYFMLKNTGLEVYPLDNDFGLTFIKMPAEQVDINNISITLSFHEFDKFIKTQKLYSNKEMIEILRKKHV